MSDSVLTYDIGPLEPDERNYVLDSWMRGTEWQRSKIVRAVDKGQTLVARSDRFILGWLTVQDGVVCHGVVREAYRQLGVMRALWEAAGCPRKLAAPATKMARKLMARVGDE
jgi:hypothetical protein